MFRTGAVMTARIDVNCLSRRYGSPPRFSGKRFLVAGAIDSATIQRVIASAFSETIVQRGDCAAAQTSGWLYVAFNRARDAAPPASEHELSARGWRAIVEINFRDAPVVLQASYWATIQRGRSDSIVHIRSAVEDLNTGHAEFSYTSAARQGCRDPPLSRLGCHWSPARPS
jgi:hypothetical protein